MNRMNINFVILIAFLMGNQLFNGPLFAQSIWLNQQGGKNIAIEILKPNFDGEDDFTFMSAALFLRGRFPLNNKVMFVGELPLAYGGADSDNGGSDSEANIGNPYVGLEYRPQDSPVFVELGGRLPVTSENKDIASVIGLWSDFDRFEAFIPDVITLKPENSASRLWNGLFIVCYKLFVSTVAVSRH